MGISRTFVCIHARGGRALAHGDRAVRVSRAYRYPPRAMAADYARAGVGAAIFLSALAWLEPAAPIAGILTAGAALFLVYFARTVCRQLTRIELDETGIRARGPLGAAIRWGELRSLRLDYYS